MAAITMLLPGTAHAGPGSGTATMLQPGPAVAASRHQWTIVYTAAEDFDNPMGGLLEIQIPAGWSPPQATSPSTPGYVDYTNPLAVQSMTITGQTIRLVLGGGPQFRSGDAVSVQYGVGGGNALAATQTTAPATARFFVRSDPDRSDAAPGDTLVTGSPAVAVVPDTVVSVQIVHPTQVPVGALTRSTDQDTSHFYLRGYDQFGNSARWVQGTWSVAGGIGSVAPTTGVGTVLSLATVGMGYVVADSGSWRDSTGVITAVHGAYASLAMGSSSMAVAGTPFAASAEARDADGNRVTSGPGSATVARFVAYADSVGGPEADPLFVASNVSLVAGAWTGTLTARRVGTYFLAARDSVTGFESSPRRRLTVGPGAPDRIVLSPDTLALVAGRADTATVVVRDAYGNRSTVPADEELTLWTDRPNGRFETLGGVEIFGVTIPAGTDSVSFRFVDTQVTAAAGRLRAMDANGSMPFLGTAQSWVTTKPGAPAGAIAMTAVPDTLVADEADSARVTSAVIRDAYGNPVASGEHFAVTLAGLTAISDDDPTTAGTQWLAAPDGTIAGWVRAGATAGSGGADVVSERGSAAGSVALVLRAGPPSGPIALTATPDSLAADGLAIRSITANGLVDAHANVVADGEPYTVATTLGSIATADADPGTAGHQILATAGSIGFDLLGGDLLGTAVVSANSVRGSSGGSVNVRLVPGAVDADSSSAAAETPVAVGPPGSVLTVTLRDRRGHAIAGVPSDSIAVGASGLAPTIVALASGTDGSGAIQYAVTSTTAGSTTLSISARGVALADAPGITFQPGPLDTLVVTGPAGPLVAGTGYSLTVQARDAYGNAMPSRSDVVHLSVTTGAVTGLTSPVSLVGGSATVPFTPTAASPLTIAVADDSSHATSYGPVSVQPGSPTALVFAPASLALPAGGIDTVTVTASDAHGNPVPGTNVTVYLGSPAAGSLASLGGTTGSATTQTGAADASGQVAIRYQAPSAPGSYELFARSLTIAPVSIPVTVGASSIAALVVLPAGTTWTAGAPESVLVEARDSFGNVVAGASDSIVMGSSDTLSFNPASGPLTQGRFRTEAVATRADTLVLTAAIVSGSMSATSAVIRVVPGAPIGAIPIVADRDTLSADGRSNTAVTFGPLRDAHGNLVPAGTQLDVTVSAGTITGADASSAAGLQIAIAADTFARAVLTAPSAPGLGTIRAASVGGSARDSTSVVYLPPPSLAYAAGSLAPAATTPAQSVAFRVAVTNRAATGAVTIATGSQLSFGSGAEAFSASPSTALTLAPGQTDTLRFAPTAVSASLPPGSYAPALRLVGLDGTGEPFDFYLALAGAQVHVAGIVVTPLAASPDPVPLGHSSLVLTFQVQNLAGISGTITGASLTTTQGVFTVLGVSPTLPAALPASGSVTLTLTVAVPSSGIAPGTDVDARLAVSAAFGSASVAAQNGAPLTFQVTSAAQMAAQAAGTSPARYLRGRTFAPSARVVNTGGASVTLNQGATKLLLTGGATLQVGLAANAVVTAGGAADLAFDSLAVPPGTPLGTYAATLVLSGSESGQAFADTIPLAPATVEVLDPAILAVQGTVTPDRVSAGQTRALQVTLANAGGVPFALDGSTRLVLGAPLATSLSPVAVDTIPAGSSRVIAFEPAPIGTPATPGAAAATLEARGTEDGRFRAEALVAGTITADAPAQIVFVSGSTAPDTVRAGATIPLTLSIRNAAPGGGSPFLVDPTATRLRITDGVESAVASASGAPFSLAPGETASLSFSSVSFPPALASQSYPVALVVHGTEWGQAESTSVQSAVGEIDVVEPVPAIQVRGIDPGAPKQTAPGASFPFWELELLPLIPPGGAASSRLVAVGLTVLADGVAASDPSALLAQITLRDAQGAILAQTAPAGANPVLLVLAAPLSLTGPAASLRIEATLQPGAAAGTLALRLASGADLDVRDDLTQGVVPVLAAGGLPFQPITSAAVTLFAKPHGYPNPFRAGREDILISYRLAGDASVRIAIFTLLGDRVRELTLPPGAPGGTVGLNEVRWDGRNGKGELVRPGVYVARVEGGGVSEQIKVGVLR